MSSFDWGAAISSAGSFGSTLYSTAYNKREMERQRDWNEEMWHLKNQYDSPVAQMQRFREAGINPNMVLGEGALASGNAGDTPQSYQRPSMQPPPNPIAEYQQYRMMNAQIENLRAETRLKDSGVTRNEYLNAESFINKQLKKEQIRQLVNELEAQELKWEDLVDKIATGQAATKEAQVYAQTQGDLSRAELTRLQKVAQQEMINWLKANNLSKWIPILTALLNKVPSQ